MTLYFRDIYPRYFVFDLAGMLAPRLLLLRERGSFGIFAGILRGPEAHGVFGGLNDELGVEEVVPQVHASSSLQKEIILLLFAPSQPHLLLRTCIDSALRLSFIPHRLLAQLCLLSVHLGAPVSLGCWARGTGPRGIGRAGFWIVRQSAG